MLAGLKLLKLRGVQAAHVRNVLLSPDHTSMLVAVGGPSLQQVIAESSLLNVCSPTDQGLCAG